MSGTHTHLLRRTKTDSEGDIERFNAKLKKIKNNSEKLSRRSRPERKAKRLLNDLKALPRPCSPSTSEAFLDVLDTIGDKTKDCEIQILKLSERPDLSHAIKAALESDSLEPLLVWPERVWTKSAYRRLSMDKETGKLREDCSLTVRLLATWMKECIDSTQTYLRSDSGGGRKLFKFLFTELDPWKPVLNRHLFRQCIIHCMALPEPLLHILIRLRKEVPDLSAESLISAILLGCYLPKAQKEGFPLAEIQEAMRSCSNPPKECAWMMERVQQCVAPKKRRVRLSSSSVES